MLNAGEQILRAMGSLQDVRDMSGNCDGILADAMIGVSYFTNLSRIDSGGTMVCSAVPLAKGINIAKQPVFDRVKAAKSVVVGTRTISQASGRPVVGTQLPLLKPDGSFDGSLAITLDVQWFDYLLRAHPLPKGAVVAVIYDRNGVILASQRLQPGARLDRGGGAEGRLAGRRFARRPLSGRACLAFRQCRASGRHICSSPMPNRKAGCSARPICMSGSISCCRLS